MSGMAEDDELNDVQNLVLEHVGGDSSSDSVEFIAPSAAAEVLSLSRTSISPSVASPDSRLRNSSLSPEPIRAESSPRLTNSPRMDSPRWRPSPSIGGSGTIRGEKASANEVLMGARRTKEALQLAEESATLSKENAELKQLVRKLQAQEEKHRQSRAGDAERIRGLLAANQAHANVAVAQAEQDTIRAHQMTLSVLTQYRDYMAAAESRALVSDRQLNETKEIMDYFRARSKQTEELAKAVVMFVRNEGLDQQQAALSAAIKSSREKNPLPPKPQSTLVADWTPEERRLEAEKEIAAVAESDVLRSVPKFAALVDRVREFEHFLELKRQKAKRDLLQKQTSGDDVTVGLSSATSGPTALLTREKSHSVSGGMVLGVKAAQITGDSGLSPVSVSPSATLRKFGSTGAQALVKERKTPQDFPFYELPSVLHVQRLVSTLAVRWDVDRTRPVTPQSDALREEANRPSPNYEWLCGELVSAKKRARVDPEWRTDSGKSLLHVICEWEGSGRAVKVLLKDKYDCCALDEFGLSAFHVACMSGATDAVQTMCKMGPKSVMDMVCLADLTPMHAAALFNRISVIKTLLERGANGAPLDALGCSPLVYAVMNDKFSTARFLAEKVHGLVNTCQDGNSPLLFACCVAGVSEVTALLGAGANPNVANNHGISPLWIAMQNDDADLALALLDYKPSDVALKANLDQPLGPFGNTLMMQALAFLSVEAKVTAFVNMLLAKGASVHAANKDKKTALFFALAFDRMGAVRLLLEHGADPNVKDSNQNRPLHFVQSMDAVTLLVSSGAKVNVKNKQGNTPLHVAFALQNRMTANMLISSGGNESSLNNDGQTCRDLALCMQTKFALPFFAGDISFAETGGIQIK